MKNCIRLCLSVYLLFGLSTAFATPSKVHEYTLKNGLKLIVKENHRAPAVVSQIWYRVGSAFEPGGITGVSHVLEHMMFKGTRRYPAGEFSKLIAENGGQENAFTSNDFTAYFQKLPAVKYPLSFRLEADRMQHLKLTATEFKKEIEVVKEERRMRTDDNPQALTYERFIAAAHLTQPYHHMTIGWMSDLQHMTVSDLQTWYKKWYAPNNAIIVVVGDVNPKQVYEASKRYFDNIPRRKLPSVKPQAEPASLGLRHVVVKRPAKLPLLLMGYNTPSVLTAKTSWKPYALEVLVTILDGGDSARFSTDLIRGQQIASQAGAGYSLFSRYSGLLSFEGIPTREHSVEELKNAFLKQVERLQTSVVTPEELQRVKTQIVAEKIYQQDSLYGQAMEIGRLESVGLSWREGDNYVKNIQAITAEQVQAVAREFLIPNHLTIAELQPQPLPGDNHAQQ